MQLLKKNIITEIPINLITGPAFTDFLLQPFRKPKRVRTAFSPTQLLKLEHAFEGNHYVVGAERKTLAQQLSLSETQVRGIFHHNKLISLILLGGHPMFISFAILSQPNNTSHAPK